MTVTIDQTEGILGQLLADSPHTFSVSDESGDHTGYRIRRWTQQTQFALQRSGVSPGDRVVVTTNRSARAFAQIIGVLNARAIAVPIDTSLPTNRRTAIETNCGAKWAISTSADSSDQIRRTASDCDTQKDAEELAGSLLIYTSGSSGNPKGIVCPPSAIQFAINAIHNRLGYRADDVIAQPLPLTFDYGLYQLLLAMKSGAQVQLYPEGAAGPSFLSRLRNDGITVLPSMPVLSDTLIRVSQRRQHTLDQIRLVTTTGGHCSSKQLDDLKRLAPHADVLPMYGLTECKRATITVPGEPGEDNSAGRPLAGTQVVVMADHSKACDQEKVGEIHVGGPHVMLGYWPLSDAELNRSFYTAEDGTRWVATGDTGYIDQDGLLHVTGRQDDLFKHNGYRTSVSEVETALLAIDGITHACVVPPDQATTYAAVFAGSISEEEVRTQLADHLELAKHPPRLARMRRVPVTKNGKVDRQAIAAHLRKEIR